MEAGLGEHRGWSHRPALSLLSRPGGGGTGLAAAAVGPADDVAIGCVFRAAPPYGLKRASGRASGRIGLMADGSDRM